MHIRTNNINYKTEVLITGHFAVLHAGHVKLLEFGSKYGKVTVGLNGDEIAQKKYGLAAIPLIDRAYILSSCKFVDTVTFFNEETPTELILRLKPKYFIRGPDYLNQALPEQSALDEVGTQVIIQPAEKIFNASDLIKLLPRKSLA